MGLQYTEPLEHGQFDVQTVAAPGNNTEFSFTFNSQFKRQIIGITYRFTCDVNAATRFMNLTLDDGTNIMWRVFSGANQIALSAINYGYAVGLGSGVFVNTNGAHIGLPYPFAAPPLSVLRSVTTNMQAGDTYTNIVITSQLWIP